MGQLEKLKRRLDIAGAEKDGLLTDLLDEAQTLILLYTKRAADEWLAFFDSVQVASAAALYNRLGAEGYSSRSEGAVSTSFEGLPVLLSPLNPFRKARAV